MTAQNSLTLQGTVTEIKDTEKGGKNSQWIKRTLVLSASFGKFDNLVAIEFFGEERAAYLDGVQIGDQVEIGVSIKSNEYNGRHYTTVSGWKIKDLGAYNAPSNTYRNDTLKDYYNNNPQNATKTSPQSTSGANAQQDEFDDDIPF